MKAAKKLFVCLMMLFSSAIVFAEEWYVCAGSFSKEENAKDRCQILDEKGLASFEGVVQVKGKTLYRVFIDKAFDTEGKAVAYRNQLSRDENLAKIDRSNFWCVRYSGAKNRYVFVKTGKEIIKEVPVVKEVVKEVPVEKEVIKEVPVEKEVIKEVPVIKEVIKEVPVEKIVYRDAPAPEKTEEPKEEEKPAEEAPVEEPPAEEPAPETPAEEETPPLFVEPEAVAPAEEVAPEVPAEPEVPPVEETPEAEVPAEPEIPAEEPPAEEAAPEVPEEPQPEIANEPEPEPIEDVNVDLEGRNLLVKDADTGLPVAGAVVSIDKGKWEVVTDENGIVEIPAKVKNGKHTLLITKDEEYVPTEQELVIAKKKIASANQISIPKVVSYDRIKIILDWGKYPRDLDANIIVDGQRIYYKNQNIEGIRLDRDDKDSYGPETITLENPDPSKTYSYYVSDYSNDNNEFSNYLSKSGATVVVYKNNDFYNSYTFERPTSGITWHVFDIVNGDIVEVNKITTDHIEDLASGGSSSSNDFANAK